MSDIKRTGRVTIPTDLDVVTETLEIMKRWGADAIRDCDGTDFPQSSRARMPRSTPPTTPPVRTMSGPRPIPTKSSSATS